MNATPHYDMKERRGYFRIRTILPALFRKDGLLEPIEATTENLSLDGVAIETRQPLIKGQLLGISIALDSKLILCRTKVIHVERLRGKRFRVGLQFQDISEENRRLLAKYLSCLMRRRKEGYKRTNTREFPTRESIKVVPLRKGTERNPMITDHRVKPEKADSKGKRSKDLLENGV